MSSDLPCSSCGRAAYPHGVNGTCVARTVRDRDEARRERDALGQQYNQALAAAKLCWRNLPGVTQALLAESGKLPEWLTGRENPGQREAPERQIPDWQAVARELLCDLIVTLESEWPEEVARRVESWWCARYPELFPLEEAAGINGPPSPTPARRRPPAGNAGSPDA
jgi:hypothetical protein